MTKRIPTVARLPVQTRYPHPPKVRFRASQRGVVMVETAFVLSLTLLLIFAGLEIGLVIAKHNSVNYAAAAAARFAATYVNGTARASASDVTAFVTRLPDMSSATVTYSCATGSPPCLAGDSAVVNVRVPHTGITRLVPGFTGSRTIAATGTWRVQDATM